MAPVGSMHVFFFASDAVASVHIVTGIHIAIGIDALARMDVD